RAGGAGIVEPEDQDGITREVADKRVVAVDGERHAGQAAHRRPPALGDQLELAVTVELIAEEIPEAERARPQPARDLRQRAFVDLEEPELSPAGGEQGRGDAGDEVRARRVVG